MSEKRHCCLIWYYWNLCFSFFPFFLFAFLLVFSLGFSPLLFCFSLACVECSNSVYLFIHSKYGSFIFSSTNSSWTLPLTGRQYVAEPSHSATWLATKSSTWTTSSCSSSPKSLGHRWHWTSPSTYEQNPWWLNGRYNMWGSPSPHSGRRTCIVHLQYSAQYTPVGNLHGVQPVILHQSAHLVYVGSILISFIYGHQMARRYWRYICSPQRGIPHHLSERLSLSLDRGTRTQWVLFK